MHGQQNVKKYIVVLFRNYKMGSGIYISEKWLSMKGERARKEDAGSSRCLRLSDFMTIGT